MKYAVVLTLSLMGGLCSTALAQTRESIKWQRCLGGTRSVNTENNAIPTKDGGYVVFSSVESDGKDAIGGHGRSDVWAVKLDSVGTVQWQRCYGGSNLDYFAAAAETSDGGFVVASTTYSNDGDVSGNHGGDDLWVIRLDATGALLWQKCLGGTSDDEAKSVRQLHDGSYIVSGWTTSTDGDVAGKHSGAAGTGRYPGSDAWLVKLDSFGQLVWQRCLGSSGDDKAFQTVETSDTALVMVGAVSAADGDVAGYVSGNQLWVVKLTETGKLLWQTPIRGADIADEASITQSTDGGFAIATTTRGKDSVSAGNHGAFDILLIKLDGLGNVDWHQCFGGGADDHAFGLLQLPDSGFVIVGAAGSIDGDVRDNHGTPLLTSDAWLLHTDDHGNLISEQCFGGTSDEWGSSVVLANDRTLLFTGSASSTDGDVVGLDWSRNLWVVKLGPQHLAVQRSRLGHDNVAVFPNPVTNSLTFALQVAQEGKARGQIIISDLLGRTIFTSRYTGVFSTLRVTLPSGRYTFEVIPEIGPIQRGSFIKE